MAGLYQLETKQSNPLLGLIKKKQLDVLYKTRYCFEAKLEKNFGSSLIVTNEVVAFDLYSLIARI